MKTLGKIALFVDGVDQAEKILLLERRNTRAGRVRDASCDMQIS